jgi:2-oxoglutarate ferredoxin oxidoreductase subunit alpha
MTKTAREFTDGATAIVRGALAAGCTFFAGYPITPASPILMHMMRALPRAGGVAIQAEDEIASISMCLGAAMTGARAFTATSGPGISLYSENIGLAIMGEVPLVIADVQRQGPATGGATTVGQGDVQFARWGTSGGYPIIALAPSSIPECYTLTIKAFELADRFRCPVFLMADKELVMTMNTVQVEQGLKSQVQANLCAHAQGQARDEQPVTEFKPYRYDPPDGAPPLAVFGGDHIVRFTGSSHDERGLLSKQPATVGALNQHLDAKITQHRDEIELVTADLQPGAKTLLVSYGVTARAMHEAVQQVRKQDNTIKHGNAQGDRQPPFGRTSQRVSALTIHSLWPAPETAIKNALRGIERVVVAELNLGDYRREIERIACGRAEVVGVNRVDGELISPEQMVEQILT